MVDLAHVPGVLEQLKLVAGLRWTILKNGLQRKNNRWDLLGMALASIFGGLFVFGLCFVFFATTESSLAKDRPEWIALLYWAVFLWWQAFPLFLAGFGANFEFGTLLRFPLSLRAFYLLALGYGLADFAALSSIGWVISMLLGAAWARPGVLPVMLPVSVAFMLINATLERLFGSWLEKILAKRRSRELFIGLFVLSMVSLNFLTPVLQRYGRTARPLVLKGLTYLSWLPPSLVGQAVKSAASADGRGIVTSSAGILCWLALLSALLWRRFAAQYRGEAISDSPAPRTRKKGNRKDLAAGTDWRFPSPQIVAVVIKEFRYLTRNGFASLTLILPPVMVLFFSMQFGNGSVLKEHSVKPELFFPGMMAYLLLILLSPAYNAFAYEGPGIQAYFMAPVDFREILLGKNLFLAGTVLFELALSFALLAWRIGLPSAPILAATIAAGAFAMIGQLTVANWSSLSFPKKMEIGKMKGQRNSGVAVWTAFGVQFALGGLCALILLGGRLLGDPWLPAIVFVVLAGAALAGYGASLRALGRLAETKKELLIETLCR